MDKPMDPPPRVTPPRGRGGGSAAAAVTLPGAVRHGQHCRSCPQFLPAAGRGEIGLVGNEAPFAQEEPDLCAAGQRMLSFSFSFFF